MAIQPEVTAGGSRQRMLVLALAGVLLVVLAAVVARPLLQGEAQAPPAAVPVTAGLTPTPTTVTQVIPPSTSIAGPTAGTTKDPFRPVVGAGAGGATTSTAVTTTTTTGAAPTTTVGSGAASATTAASGTTARK